MNIIISPFSRKLRNGNLNPKEPSLTWWSELIGLLKEKDYYIIQIGIDGEDKLKNVNEYQFNLNLKELKQLTLFIDTFISIDNFYSHFCALLNKSGIVIFSQSDPLIFGHKLHINLLKNIKYLRGNQFNIWETAMYIEKAFIEPQKVIEVLTQL